MVEFAGRGAALQVDPDEEEALVDDDDLVEEDLLVEDVSIDGMCGVY
ncbi:MAG TPA: mycofactocin precursor MftA [Acidimicrobiales bacterium]|nr:mycofactocin precursor MftA [Acidimicrobiales bacterium]